MIKKRKTLISLIAATGCAALIPLSALGAKTGTAVPATTIIATGTAQDSGEIFVVSSFISDSYDELAKEGIISQEQATKMNAFIKQYDEQLQQELDRLANRSESELETYFANSENSIFQMDSLTQMVTEQIINQTEKERIEAYYQAKMTADYHAEISSSAKRYVDEAIIPQSTADQMVAEALRRDEQESIGAIGQAIEVVLSSDINVANEETSTIEFATYSVFDLDGLVASNTISKLQKEAIEASDQAYFKTFDHSQ